MQETIAVVGLGYVGLPVALAIARRFPGTIGFDINSERVASLKSAHDQTGETTPDELRSVPIEFTTDEAALRRASFFIVAVPTPVERRARARPHADAQGERNRRPGAPSRQRRRVRIHRLSGRHRGHLRPAARQGLAASAQELDFKLGYSPERINPGDREHRSRTSPRSSPARTPETLERSPHVYGSRGRAGVYKAPSIRVAEAAKVIENTQRDLNIALMNELALIFDRIGIRTRDVLEAAGTKWNFLPLRPRPGRRPLHRRRSLLPDDRRRGGRLSPPGHPGRPPHQRQHGRVHRAEGGQAAGRRPTSASRARASASSASPSSKTFRIFAIRRWSTS